VTVEQMFAKRLREQRTRRGWSQTMLADRMRTEGVDLHPTAITRMESGERGIRLNEAVAAAAALTVPLEHLLKLVFCDQCVDAPPTGFTCQKCGAT